MLPILVWLYINNYTNKMYLLFSRCQKLILCFILKCFCFLYKMCISIVDRKMCTFEYKWIYTFLMKVHFIYFWYITDVLHLWFSRMIFALNTFYHFTSNNESATNDVALQSIIGFSSWEIVIRKLPLDWTDKSWQNIGYFFYLHA